MKVLISIILFTYIMYACASTANVTLASIELVQLNNYVLNTDTALNSDIQYVYYNEENEFQKMFSATRMKFGSAVAPDFNSQAVLAIILQPTEKVVSIDINKTYVLGSTLKIDYSIVDTTDWRSYRQTPVFVAAIAKIPGVKSLQFYRDGQMDKTISIQNKP